MVVVTMDDINKGDGNIGSGKNGIQTYENLCNRVTLGNIKDFIFDGFSFKTFVFLTIVIQLGAFIAELSFDFNGFHFMESVSNKTLRLLGAFNWPLIKNGEVHRFLISSIYNYSILTLSENILLISLIGFRLERDLGVLKFVILYFISGIVSLCCTGIYEYSLFLVGSFYQCSALVGAFVGEFIAIDIMGEKNQMFIIKLCIFVIFFVKLLIPIQKIFRIGEIGGFFTGILIYLIYKIREGYKHKYIIYGLVVCGLVLISLITSSMFFVFTRD